MPLYKQDPNNPKKQIPDVQGQNRADRYVSPANCTIIKSPNFVYCSTDVTLGFFSGTSASYSEVSTTEGSGNTLMTSSANYASFNLKAGQSLNINPIAVSGSTADLSKVKFVYKSGLATGGF